MAQDTNDIKLGRFLSLVLRHKPSAAGITLDAHGWADVDELLSGVRRTGRQIDMDTLERIVRENNKRATHLMKAIRISAPIKGIPFLWISN